MNNRGVLIIVSGFSGSGKGTVMKKLTKTYNNYKLSISATTRNPREGEINGKEYFFLTKDKFESMIKDGEFIEWAEYVGNYYGTPKSYVEEQLNNGNNVILEIEMQGAMKVKEQYPEAVLIFLSAPDFRTLLERLTGRGTEDLNTVNRRLKRSIEETEYIKFYNHLVINSDIEECVTKINSIILEEKEKLNLTREYVEKFVNDASTYFTESR